MNVGDLRGRASGTTLIVEGEVAANQSVAGFLTTGYAATEVATAPDATYNPIFTGDWDATFDSFDASGVTGKGVSLWADSFDATLTVVGSGLDDDLSTGAGNDLIDARGGSNRVDAGAGDDTLIAAGARGDYSLDWAQGSYRLTDAHGLVVDSFANVEHVRFADATVDVNPHRTALTAAANDGTLTVLGHAASAAGVVEVTLENGSADVRDSGGGEIVPVALEGTAITSIELSGFEGAGASIALNEAGAARVGGTAHDDIIRAGYQHTGGDEVHAGAGNDEVYGGSGNDHVFGNGGNDLLDGGDGNDRLRGSAGDDTIDGGAGDDTAVFRGNYADFAIKVVAGQYQVTDTRTHAIDGTDTVVNVEHLDFDDRTLDVPAVPTSLTAVLHGHVLSVSGEAKSAVAGDHVEVDLDPAALAVRDNGAGGVGLGPPVPITGDESSVTRLDLSGLTNVGAYVNPWSDAGTPCVVIGSRFLDVIDGTRGDDQLHGYRGDDSLSGGFGRDYLNGGSGNDVLSGDGGDDLIKGGKGDDRILGGEGTDTADFSSAFPDYTFADSFRGLVVTDARTAHPDGVDTIEGVEFFHFSDRTVDLATIYAGLHG